MSTCEVEYKSGAAVCKPILYSRRLFQSFRQQFPEPCTILQDNMGMISLSSGPSQHHQRTKNIGTKYHFQRELVRNGVVRYQHQETEHQFTDIYTKGLARPASTRHKNAVMGIAALLIKTKLIPESQNLYEEVRRREKQRELKLAYEKVQKLASKEKAIALLAIDKRKKAGAKLAKWSAAKAKARAVQATGKKQHKATKAPVVHSAKRS